MPDYLLNFKSTIMSNASTNPSPNAGGTANSSKIAGLSWKLEQAESNIKIIRILLYGLAGLIFLGSMFTMFLVKNFSIKFILTILGFTGFYLFCGYMTKRRPLLAMLLALGSYIAFLLYPTTGISSPSTTGMVMKAVVFLVFAVGIYFAFNAEKLKKQIAQEAGQ